MRAGSLKHKAMVFVPSTSTNDFGELNTQFQHMGTYACAVQSRVKREYNEASTVVSKTQYDLTFRYYPALIAIPRDSYIVVGGVTLDIVAMANDNLRNKAILVRCEERS